MQSYIQKSLITLHRFCLLWSIRNVAKLPLANLTKIFSMIISKFCLLNKCFNCIMLSTQISIFIVGLLRFKKVLRLLISMFRKIIIHKVSSQNISQAVDHAILCLLSHRWINVTKPDINVYSALSFIIHSWLRRGEKHIHKILQWQRFGNLLVTTYLDSILSISIH